MLNQKIKIGYFADGPWSHLAFEKLIVDDSIQIQFIVPRADTKDFTLKKYSEKYGIHYIHPVNINSLSFIETAKSYSCDLFVSMSFNQIFKSSIINIPRYGVINCHAGKLPFYRGRNVLNWALINDEKEFGITVHYIDEGIDTGDIIKQRCFDITDDHDYKELLNISYVECSNLLYESIKDIQNGVSKRIVQHDIHKIGFYCGKRGEGDEIINWNQNSRDLFNFIRAINKPGPMALTFLNGNEIRINKSRLIDNAPRYKGTNGQLISKTNDGFLIKTLDSFLEIYEIETTLKLRVGNKLK